jgi:hypothetical protein
MAVVAVRAASSGEEREREQQRRAQFAEGHSRFAIDARSYEFASLLRLATAISRTAAALSSADCCGWLALNSLISGAPPC